LFKVTEFEVIAEFEVVIEFFENLFFQYTDFFKTLFCLSST